MGSNERLVGSGPISPVSRGGSSSLNGLNTWKCPQLPALSSTSSRSGHNDLMWSVCWCSDSCFLWKHICPCQRHPSVSWLHLLNFWKEEVKEWSFQFSWFWPSLQFLLFHSHEGDRTPSEIKDPKIEHQINGEIQKKGMKGIVCDQFPNGGNVFSTQRFLSHNTSK